MIRQNVVVQMFGDTENMWTFKNHRETWDGNASDKCKSHILVCFSSLPKTAVFEEPQEMAVVAEFGKRERTVVFNLHLSFISLISPCVGVS